MPLEEYAARLNCRCVITLRGAAGNVIEEWPADQVTLVTTQRGAAWTPDIVWGGADVISEEAEARADALLLEHLDKKQRRDWRSLGRFDVRAASGHVYTIIRYWPVRRDDGREFCLQSLVVDVPEADECLARKLLLETDEQKFLETANDLGNRFSLHSGL